MYLQDIELVILSLPINRKPDPHGFNGKPSQAFQEEIITIVQILPGTTGGNPSQLIL